MLVSKRNSVGKHRNVVVFALGRRPPSNLKGAAEPYDINGAHKLLREVYKIGSATVTSI